MKKARKQSKSSLTAKTEPLLGIFWLVDGKLVIDSLSLASAVPYGSRVTHPADHIDRWEVLKHNGRVPRGSEYEEYPRGRTIHDLLSGEATIFADKCILRRKEIVKQIKETLHLPNDTKLDTDPHYRCSKCLYGKGTDEDWEV